MPVPDFQTIMLPLLELAADVASPDRSQSIGKRLAITSV
jgi:hypothetical protein